MKNTEPVKMCFFPPHLNVGQVAREQVAMLCTRNNQTSMFIVTRHFFQVGFYLSVQTQRALHLDVNQKMAVGWIKCSCLNVLCIGRICRQQSVLSVGWCAPLEEDFNQSYGQNTTIAHKCNYLSGSYGNQRIWLTMSVLCVQGIVCEAARRSWLQWSEQQDWRRETRTETKMWQE